MAKPIPLADRFWARVDKNGPIPEHRPDLGPCWVWTRLRTPLGYGRFAARPSHQIAYELEYGPIPDGLEIDHLCRFPPCQRPSHLEAVTRQENALRGIGPTAKNARKTHCPKGHPYDQDNTRIERYGGRRCRACERAKDKKRRRR